jgi:uroporphyrinogen-III synthase
MYVNFRLQGAKKDGFIFLSPSLIRTLFEFFRQHEVKDQFVHVTAERTVESITDVTVRTAERKQVTKRKEGNAADTEILFLGGMQF